MLIVHDDLTLPLGTVRVRQKGSDAGNNGVKSINQYIGDRYDRIRVGTWSEHRNSVDDADFVLSAFTKDELEKLHESVIPHANELIDQFLGGTLEPTSTVLS